MDVRSEWSDVCSRLGLDNYPLDAVRIYIYFRDWFVFLRNCFPFYSGDPITGELDLMK